MQRSMVHELSGLTSSQFINNRSTFISTAFNEGDYELRKSRIQNLPSYRKEDLSTKPNFVIVFQTIEIQRLSNQIEALRIALKDEQRQNFNVQNYQVQIRELTQKCFAYENQRGEYREQIDKLNMICQKLYEQLQTLKTRYNDVDPTLKQKYRLEKQRTRSLEQDIQKWRFRYNALEVSKTRQMQDIKLMMQNQRKSIIDRQIKQLTLKSQIQRENLQKQIRKIRQAYQNKDNELKRVNSKLLQLEILNKELKQYEKTIYEYENKFAMLSQEMMRLNDILRRKEEEIDRYMGMEGNYKRVERELQRKIRQLQQNGGQKAKILQNKLKEQRAKYYKLEAETNQYKKQLSQIPEFKAAIQQINVQSEKLRDMVRLKIGQIDNWKNKYQKTEAELKQNKIKNEEKIPAFENKIKQLNTQNDRLNNVLKSRTTEIENWKEKISGIEKQLLMYSGLEKDKKNLQNQLNINIKQINDMQSNIKQLQSQNRRLGEVEKDLLREKSEKQEGRKQINRLNNLVRGTSQKIQSLERKCGNLERDLKNYVEIQEQIRIYKQKQINMTKEIDRINGIIVEKIKEIQALKQVFQRFEGKLTQYQGLEKKLVDSVGQTQKLMQDLDQSRREAAMLQDKLLSTQSESKKLKNDVFSLAQERQQLTKVLTTKTQQLQTTQTQLAQFQNQITRLRSFQARFIEIQEKYKANEGKLAQVNRRYKLEQNKYLEANQKLEQTLGELMKVKRQGAMSPKFKEEFAEVVRQTQRRQRETKNLQQRINLIEGILKKLKENTVRQQQVSKKNHQKILSIGKQFDLSSQAYKKIFDLQTQIIKLNQHIMSLQSKLSLTNIQNETYKQSQSRRINLDLNPISLSVSKSQQVLSKSPIDLLATKRIQTDSQIFSSPSYIKSSSVSNMLNTNTNKNTNKGYGIDAASNKNKDISYQYQYEYKDNNNNTNTNTYNNAYSYFNTNTNTSNHPDNITNNNTDNYAYSYAYNSSTKPRHNSPGKNIEPRQRSNANFNTTLDNNNNNYTSYISAYNVNTTSNISSSLNNASHYNNYNSPTYQPNTNLGPSDDYARYKQTTDTMPLNMNRSSQANNLNNTNAGNAHKLEGLKADTYVNFQAFSTSKRNSLGVRPAGQPLQFRSTNRTDC